MCSFRRFAQCDIGVFSKWRKTFIEFSEFRKFRESDKSLRHELGSVQGSALSSVSLWDYGIISLNYTGCPGFQSYNLPFDFNFLSLNSANSMKAFGEILLIFPTIMCQSRPCLLLFTLGSIKYFNQCQTFADWLKRCYTDNLYWEF